MKNLYNPYKTFKQDILELQPHIIGESSKYFDYTASGLAFKPIEKRIRRVLETYANTHSYHSFNAKTTQYYYTQAKDIIRECLNISDDFCILPSGTGTTSAIKHLQQLLGIYLPPNTKKRLNLLPDDVPLVIVGPYEHHSNEVSFREALCDVIRVPLKDNVIDIDILNKILFENQHREIIASFSLVSNVTGVQSDYKTISNLVRQYKGFMCFDCAASSPYINIDSCYYDALVMSPHKLLGGPGSCGLLIVRKSAVECDKPSFAGGGTVDYVSKDYQIYLKDIETIEDPGTPGIIQLIRAAMSYKLRNDLGLEEIRSIKKANSQYFTTRLLQINNIDLYSPVYDNNGIISFNIKGTNPYDLCQYLSDDGFQTRAGCSCAGPYGHDLLQLTRDDVDLDFKPGWLRVSIHYSHNYNNIDNLLTRLNNF